MAEETSNILSIIGDLVETCRDGATGYLHAAGVANDARLKTYFEQQSLERNRMLQELKDEMTKLGEKDPDTSGSVAAVVHRMWFEVKADIGLGDEAILNSVEQGEGKAKDAYQKALQENLPDNIRQIVSNQERSVQAAHDRVRDLRDKAA